MLMLAMLSWSQQLPEATPGRGRADAASQPAEPPSIHEPAPTAQQCCWEHCTPSLGAGEPRIPTSQDQKWSFFIPPSLRRTDWKPSSLPTKPGQSGVFTSISPAVHTLAPLPSPAGHGGPITPPVPQWGWERCQQPPAGCRMGCPSLCRGVCPCFQSDGCSWQHEAVLGLPLLGGSLRSVSIFIVEYCSILFSISSGAFPSFLHFSPPISPF